MYNICMIIYKSIFKDLRTDIILALIVNACCVLHNVAKFYNVPEPEVYYDNLDMDEGNRIWGNENRNGNDIRESIIRLYFS